jgi:hypothetical protein
MQKRRCTPIGLVADYTAVKYSRITGYPETDADQKRWHCEPELCG